MLNPELLESRHLLAIMNADLIELCDQPKEFLEDEAQEDLPWTTETVDYIYRSFLLKGQLSNFFTSLRLIDQFAYSLDQSSWINRLLLALEGSSMIYEWAMNMGEIELTTNFYNQTSPIDQYYFEEQNYDRLLGGVLGSGWLLIWVMETIYQMKTYHQLPHQVDPELDKLSYLISPLSFFLQAQYLYSGLHDYFDQSHRIEQAQSIDLDLSSLDLQKIAEFVTSSQQVQDTLFMMSCECLKIAGHIPFFYKNIQSILHTHHRPLVPGLEWAANSLILAGSLGHLSYAIWEFGEWMWNKLKTAVSRYDAAYQWMQNKHCQAQDVLLAHDAEYNLEYMVKSLQQEHQTHHTPIADFLEKVGISRSMIEILAQNTHKPSQAAITFLAKKLGIKAFRPEYH